MCINIAACMHICDFSWLVQWVDLWQWLGSESSINWEPQWSRFVHRLSSVYLIYGLCEYESQVQCIYMWVTFLKGQWNLSIRTPWNEDTLISRIHLAVPKMTCLCTLRPWNQDTSPSYRISSDPSVSWLERFHCTEITVYVYMYSCELDAACTCPHPSTHPI